MNISIIGAHFKLGLSIQYTVYSYCIPNEKRAQAMSIFIELFPLVPWDSISNIL